MIVLGLHGNFGRSEHDAAAAIMRDGEVLAAVEEERFIRQKHASGLIPEHAIRYCLAQAGVDMREVSYVAFPRATWSGFEERLAAFLTYRFGFAPPVRFVQHHLAHALVSYLGSGFPRALVVTLDQSGDGDAASVYRADGTSIQPVLRERFPNSLGLFAALMTQYLGFRSNDGEYKVMGLAAHGTPSYDLNFLLEVSDGGFRFNPDYLHREAKRVYPEFHTEQLPLFGAALRHKLPPPRLPGTPISDVHADLAASVQRQIVRAATAFVDSVRQPGDDCLCLAGGLAQNTLLNAALVETGWFRRVYVPPAAGDAGTALGAAMAIALEHGAKPGPLTGAALGPGYTAAEIAATLKRVGAAATEVEDPAEVAAGLLARGQVVAWFQGRAEFGPRALGNRSLLANPQRAEARAAVNRVKERDPFRPFGPSLLADDVPAYFRHAVPSPFMSFAFRGDARAYGAFPAAVHIDGTSRVHTVGLDDNPYARLICAFRRQTGCPAVLNTSFNRGWEPIVLTPSDALATFFSSAIDGLLLDRFHLSKRRPGP